MTDPAEGIGPLDDDYERLRPKSGAKAVSFGLFVACLIPELVLSGADLGLWGGNRLRATAVEWAGFWPGLLSGWQPNYAVQPLTMFLTYGFLHAGFVHFAVNMLTLFSLAPPVVERIGPQRAFAIWGAALVGGALGYAAFATTGAPMVGASGALFGLAGALLAWDFDERRKRRLTLTPIWRALALLVGLNIVLWWAMHGLLAWQTHLGGFVAGWAAALYLDFPMRAKIRS